MSEDKEFTLVHGKKYQAKIHLPGFEDMASNDKIMNMLVSYGFSDVEVTGDGRDREGSATWNGETVTGPLDRHIVEISEVNPPMETTTTTTVEVTTTTQPMIPPDSPPVFEKPEKKVSASHQEEDDE